MGADKSKKLKVSEKGEEENSDHVDGDLVLSIEKLQEIQDDLEKVISFYLRFVPLKNHGKNGRRDLLLIWLLSLHFYGFSFVRTSWVQFFIFFIFFTCIFVRSKRMVF